jgi:hypothetical protein
MITSTPRDSTLPHASLLVPHLHGPLPPRTTRGSLGSDPSRHFSTSNMYRHQLNLASHIPEATLPLRQGSWSYTTSFFNAWKNGAISCGACYSPHSIPPDHHNISNISWLMTYGMQYLPVSLYLSWSYHKPRSQYNYSIDLHVKPIC